MLHTKTFSHAFSIIFALALILIQVTSVVAASATPTEEPVQTPQSAALLQYSAGGHILGFDVGKVYLAGLDHALTVEFIGGAQVKPVGTAAASTSTATQQNGVSALGRVIYQNAWQGVDVLYTAAQDGLAESTYIVQPGASPQSIQLKYNTPVQVMPDGTLRFVFMNGYITESAPIAFQEINGKRVSVDARFTLKRDRVGFIMGNYDLNYPLTIDPTFTWHTFYGSSADDEIKSITSDGSGNIYVAGYSKAAWNGPGNQAPKHAYTGGSDIVVVKLNNAGAYQWHTFYGSSADDVANGITNDGGGNIYVAGFSNASWDMPGCTIFGWYSPPCALRTHTGGAEIVVIKLNNAGTYQWHTFYGSTGGDVANDIYVNGNEIYVAGSSNATWSESIFCITPGVSPCPLHAHAGNEEMVMIKVNQNGAYQWHTFYGTSGWDIVWAVFANGNGVYMAGQNGFEWAGPSGQAPLNSNGGTIHNVAVVKLNSAGAYQWHTFYGSNGSDYATAITSDAAGNIYVTGSSGAWNGPTGIAPLNAFTGSNDLFVLKLNNFGAYQWHTFYGSSSGGEGITTDAGGNVYVAGGSGATFNGPAGQVPLNEFTGLVDFAVVKLSSAGAYRWHTFHGSTGNDTTSGIIGDADGNLYVAGYGPASWNGSTTPLHVYTGGKDMVVFKLSPSITISQAGGLTTTEGGATTSFSVMLDVQPTANVTIGLSSSQPTEGTLSTSSLDFSTSNWNTPQTVTVTGMDDFVDDGDIAYTVITAAATSTDNKYNGFNPSDVSLTNTDNDTAGFTIAPTSGLITTEEGGTTTFTVKLDSQPTANVIIDLFSSDTTEGTVSPSSLTFTDANWNVPQTVTATGVDDFSADGSMNYTIVTAAATSADSKYNGLNPSNVSIVNADNDIAGFTISPTSGLTTTEAGNTATFNVMLNTQPTADVTIGLSGSNIAEGTVSPSILTFTDVNWNIMKTVTITGVDDLVDDDDVVYTVVTAAAASTDINYNEMDPSDVSLTNSDNDIAGFTISPTSGLTTTEAGDTASFTIVLNSQPTADVRIDLSSSDTTEGRVSLPLTPIVTFTTANWNIPKTITVAGVDDFVDDDNADYMIVTAPAISADGKYSGINPSDISLTNPDDDTAGITVTPTSGLITTEAGGTATFTVVLETQPTADVTIDLSSSDTTEGTVSPSSLTFTDANWNIPKIVTVAGVDDFIDDDNVDYTIVTAPAISTDGKYTGMNPSDVSLTNTDNDVAGLTVSRTSGLITTETGGLASFTIVLHTQPIADVTIDLYSSDTTEGTVLPSSLTFTALNWNVPQTATVTGVDDSVMDGSIAYKIITDAAVSADTKYNGMNAVNVNITNTDDDTAGITVTPIIGLATSEAGGTASFTLALNSRPTANVTIGLSSSNASEGTVSPSSLTFTTANWNTSHTVTVTGVDDSVMDGNIAYKALTAAAASTDPNYNGMDAADVNIANTDNDTAGIAVAPTSGLITTEAGDTASFTVVLNSQPTANVTIGLSSPDTTEGTVSPASLTFIPSEWNTPQTVTVTGVDDADADGNVNYAITTAAAVSTDNNYNGVKPSDVSLTNKDNDTAGITVSPASGLLTTESGGMATFTVVLNSQPTANVKIDLLSSDTTEGTVSPASLTFSTLDWNTRKTVTVTGVNDFIVDGDVAYRVDTGSTSSTDGKYNAINPPDVNVTNTDNDTAGLTLSRTSGLITTEAGGSDTFTVVLNTQPTADVRIDLAGDTTEGTLSPSSLIFSSSNWNTPQTVTVTGVDDFAVDGDVAYLVDTRVIVSADNKYDGINPPDVGVSNTDNDTAGIIVAPIIGLVTTEGGGVDSFTVVLKSQPSADVTLGLSSSKPAEGTVLPASLTFTSANWGVPQTVTITGVDDPNIDGNAAYEVITAAASSTDNNYNGMNPSDVSVTNTDNDTAGVTVNPTNGLNTTEAGGTATFKVVLNSLPTADVVINLSSDVSAEGTVSPSSLTFSTSNWNIPRTVTVTSVDDFVDDGDMPYSIITTMVNGADVAYNAINPADVSIVNTDNDTAGVTVTPTSGLTTTEAGGTATFTIMLSSQPSANVRIDLSSNDPTEGTVLPLSLTFTPANWNLSQTVTITGVNDSVIDYNVAYKIITAPAISTDLLYGGMNTADVDVTNDEEDTLCANVPPITPGVDHPDVLSSITDIDPYQFEVTEPYTTIEAILTPPPADSDFELVLYNGCQNPSNADWAVDIGGFAVDIGGFAVDIGAEDHNIYVRFNIGAEIGTYYLAVKHKSGSSAYNLPYNLRVNLNPPNFTTVNTLILYNPSRFKAAYNLSIAEASKTMLDLTLLAEHPNVNGLIIQLDQFPNVVNAYAAWDADRLNVAKANAVSIAIRAAMRQYMADYNKYITGTGYVVIIGDDDQIPFYRENIQPDLIGNNPWVTETQYFSQLQNLGDVVNTPIDAALSADWTLSDNFYGDYKDRGVFNFLPSLAVGRLVDTPTRIQNMIEDFLEKDGEVSLSWKEASIAGYTFLNDSALWTCGYLQSGTMPTDCMVNESFSGNDLKQKFIGNAPAVSAHYGHANHIQLFTPAPVGNNKYDSLKALQISAANFDPLSVLWWSIGCHSGLPMPKSESTPLSLVQALADKKVTYIGNTGWAWGTNGNTLAYSEMLYQLLVKRLRVNPANGVGEALRLAKQDYFFKVMQDAKAKGKFDYSSYDAKVMAETTLYGLPMFQYTFQGIPPQQSAARQPNAKRSTEKMEALAVANASLPASFHPLEITPSNLTQAPVVSLDGTYYTGDQGNFHVASDSPILPQSEYFNFDTSLGQAKGVIWLSGDYTVLVGNNPLVANPYQLNDQPSAEEDFNGTHPLLPVTLAGLDKLDGTFINHLTFQTGQYIGTQANGSLRLFNKMKFLVGLDKANTDVTAPTITPINIFSNSGAHDITLNISDSDSGVYKAYVTYTQVNPSATSGTWQSQEMTSGSSSCIPGTQTYEADLTVTGSADFFIQVMDCAGNVAILTDNGRYFAKPGVTIKPASGLTTTEAGGAASFTVVLDTQPTADVTINLSSSDTTEGTVSPASLTFTSSNWNTLQTVTVTGVDDLNADGDAAYFIDIAPAVSADGKYNGLNPHDASLTNTDNDTPGVTVTPATGLITAEGGGTASFTVVLNTQPTADVAIDLSSSDTTEGIVSPASLTFTPSNWKNHQTVIITGVDDFAMDGGIAYKVLTAAAISADTNYSGMDSKDVSVTNTDDDIAGITVVPTNGLITTEGGGTASFTIVLDTQPTANVTIDLSSSDTTEGAIPPASLTFTPSNWNVPQAVTVTGVDDFEFDGGMDYAIVTAAAISTDTNYNGMNPANVSLVNTDNDTAGITVNPTSGLTTTEVGGTATFTVVLNSQPTADVVIDLSSSDTTEGMVSPISLTFTISDWSTPQKVTVTGMDDINADGNVAYIIITTAAVSADTHYNGLNSANVSLANNDNDTPGVTIAPTSGLTTTESGGVATFTTMLNTQPVADVTLWLFSSDTTEGIVSPSSLTFSTSNWNLPQTVTITGVEDFNVDGDVTYTVSTMAIASTDNKYNGINPPDVGVANMDDDTAAVTVTPTSGLITTEAGGAASFTVVLSSQPVATVTIGLSSSNSDEGAVSPANLTFSSSNWNLSQTVTVTGVDDINADGNAAYTVVTNAAVSVDTHYNGLDPSDVSIINNDNESAGFSVNPASGLTTSEGGGAATFTVLLNSPPTADVTVNLSSSDITEGTVSPANLTFTLSNWNTPQTVTVTGVDDINADDNAAYKILIASAVSADSKYNGIDPLDVDVINNDNDTAGITVNPVSGLTTSEGGGTASFTIALNTQPSANVTLVLISSDTTEGTISPESLTFTSSNWNLPQTATVTGVDDFVMDGSISYMIITAAATSTDTHYNGVNATDVDVANADDDITGITVSPTSGLTTTEGGGAVAFTVMLDSKPTANVTIDLSSDDTTEGTAAPVGLTFTPSNWNIPQAVTVTGVDDPDADGNVDYMILTAAAASADSKYDGIDPLDIDVTNADNDAPGITVTLADELTTTEAGGAVAFTVMLNTRPTADVAVGLSSTDITEGAVSPSSLIFTDANWNLPQTVTITGVDDSHADGDVNYTIIIAAAISADGKYNGIDPADVDIINTDNDSVAHKYLCNGGFNKYPNAATKVPTCWKSVKFGPADGKNTQFKKQGAASITFVGTRGKSTSALQFIPLSGQQGDILTFSFWVRGAGLPSGGKCAGQVYIYDGQALKQTKTLACPAGGYKFKKKSITFTTDFSYTRMLVRFTFAKSEGQVWFDTASLIRWEPFINGN